MHEGNYLAISNHPEVWGSFAWVMFDFTSIGRHEGDLDGVNDKGLVTRDRATRKDAYFFYQANWTTRPMVYITSRRDQERKEGMTIVTIYSNRSPALLAVNGKKMGAPMQTQPHVFVWKDIELTPGENRIHVEAEGAVSDDCVWTYAGPAELPD